MIFAWAVAMSSGCTGSQPLRSKSRPAAWLAGKLLHSFQANAEEGEHTRSEALGMGIGGMVESYMIRTQANRQRVVRGVMLRM